MTRDPDRLRDRPWSAEVEIVQADALDEPAVTAALDGIDVAYYLIHSLGTKASFEQRDSAAATIFARAAATAGAGRIVYLGAIVPADDRELSPLLRSRRDVGDILLAGQVPAVVLQAAVIIGSGSASFETLRYLTERLPVMVTPRWVRTLTQPIAVSDVLRYLVGCTGIRDGVSRRFDIGGPDVMSYAEMMRSYARVAGLRDRFILDVPMLSPRLSSLWVGLVTPVPAGLARPLVESLRNEVICTEHDIAAYLPDPPYGLISLQRAIALALRQVRTGEVTTRWASATSAGWADEPLPSDAQAADPAWSGGSLYVDDRVRRVRASAEHLWAAVEGIGGDRGWYSFPAAWEVRGLIDRAVGGPGLRRGRPDRDWLQAGDTVDFWRVEKVEPGSLLRLRAEMRLPGRAWLEFAVRRDDLGRTVLRQRTMFRPFGMFGQVYWWGLRPFHALVFTGMLRNVAAAAGQATLEEQSRLQAERESARLDLASGLGPGGLCPGGERPGGAIGGVTQFDAAGPERHPDLVGGGVGAFPAQRLPQPDQRLD
jgi:uncharacterized protein YbjT (DUF2867 family)